MANSWYWHNSLAGVNLAQSNAVVSQALNSAYTYGSAGAAVCFGFCLPAAKTLNTIYWYMTAMTGAPVDLNWAIRSGGTSVGSPGATVVTSGTYDPHLLTPACWMTVASGLTQALAGQTFYALVLADADGDGTNFATCIYSPGATPYGALPGWMANSTNGWTSIANVRPPGGAVLAFSDGTLVGCPYVAITNTASSTNERGLKFRFDEDTEVAGFTWYAGASTQSAFKVYEDGNNPSETTVINDTISTATGRLLGAHMLSAPYKFVGGTTYRAVLDFGSASTTLNRWSFGSGVIPTDVSNARFMRDSTWCYTEEVPGASPTWADTITLLPQMGMLISNAPAAAGAGGLLQHSGMSGGLNG